MGNGRDLGTYWLRVEFADGRGYLEKWETGARFLPRPGAPHRGNWIPLSNWRQSPSWDDEDELAHAMLFQYTEGNYSCDCNRQLFLGYSVNEDVDETCGDTITLQRLTMIRPDGSERAIFAGGTPVD